MDKCDENLLIRKAVFDIFHEYPQEKVIHGDSFAYLGYWVKRNKGSYG